jgi:hypothetical protein
LPGLLLLGKLPGLLLPGKLPGLFPELLFPPGNPPKVCNFHHSKYIFKDIDIKNKEKNNNTIDIAKKYIYNTGLSFFIL